MTGSRKNKEGASIVESCIVMILLCLILFGILQVSILTAAHDVLLYAASAGARCATIGYNDTMVEKTIRVAALPSMGPKKIGLGEEISRIRDYIAYAESADDNSLLSHIDDEYWDSIQNPSVSLGEQVTISASQLYPMTFPFAGAFYNTDYTELSTDGLDDVEVKMENHAYLYLN
ncbi:TadE/TadG family type IV pilus assembly protein [Pontiella sp.]|uniref:TadE/TadG family type IV pilus assembly protein n=1 Tax=Pontiella sp. TaxID=2837462 RepID=UPI0035692629